jgi:hypothetical protein
MATTWLVTTKTFLEAKEEVAAAIGGKVQTAVLTTAGECIQDAVREWNRYHNWQFLLSTGSAISLVAGTADYALNALFKAPYSCRIIIGSPRPLKYVEKSRWDRVVWNQTTTGRPEYYTLWNLGQQGKITMLPTPDSSIADALSVVFFRPIEIPTVDGTALDLPEQFVDAVLDLARARLLARRGGRMDLIKLFEAKGQMAKRAARADDLETADGDDTFIPSMEHETRRFTDDDTYPWWPECRVLSSRNSFRKV